MNHIFESYAKEWIPTFVMNKYEPEMLILDLFAGPGYSVEGQEGSPIRILRQVNAQLGNIFKMNKKVFILFNELNKKKVKSLEKACEDFCAVHFEMKNAIKTGHVTYKVTNVDVTKLFPRLKDKFINKYPILLFLDQNGIKFMGDDYLQPLLRARKVDFLFYLSSSYFIRFGSVDAFRNIVKVDLDKARKNPYKYIHKSILQQLRERIPKGCVTRLYPFTIKKGSNIYGIIFGASHPRGVEKFLITAWNENNINGEANFDIYDDKNKGQADLFGNIALTKKMKFGAELEKAIINRVVQTNKDAYNFALNRGHLPSHAADVIKEMKKNKVISYCSRTPMISYKSIYKDKHIIMYNIL